MKKALIVPLVVLACLLPGCAQFMAFDQPGPLNCRPDVLRPGVERAIVIGCLGPPVATDQRDAAADDFLNDTYVYKDGGGKNAGWSKAGRVILYTAGDLVTLFLSQIIWMPAEKLMLDASKYQASVDYERGHTGKWRIQQATESKVD